MAHTGGMIALIPSAADAARLVADHPDAEPVEELHLTLGFLGEDVRDWPPENRETLLAEMREIAAGEELGSAAGAVTARIMGHAVFNPDSHGDRKPCAVYLVGDSTALPRWVDRVHARIGEKIGVPAQHSPWIGHVTAGFGVPVDALSYTGPITFDRLRVALAGEHHDIALAPATEDGDPDPDDPDVEIKVEEKVGVPRGIEEKVKVASEAGEERYKLPIGTELGQARNARAAEAQTNPRARDQYDTLVNAADPKAMRALVDQLDAADLKALAAVTYSFRSSNPKVVAARVALAGALRRAGLDVNDFGGLGRSTSGRRSKAAPKSRTRGKAGKAPAQTRGNASGRRGVNARGTQVDVDRLSDAELERYRRAGWKGRAGDGAERLYAPGAKGADMADIETFDAVLDAALDAASAGAETKARTTTKPWKKDDAKKAGHTLGAGKGDEAKEYVIKTVGDVAAAVKRAKSIKDEEKRRKVRAHIRKEAARLNARNMIPAEWGTGGAEKKDAGGAVLLPSDWALADAIERKVMSADPRAAKLREYWAHGAGRSKWRPGTPGDFERLKRAVRKHIPAHMLNGWVANVHKLATGQWPGRGRGHGKAAGGEHYEIGEILAGLGGPDSLDVKAGVISLDELADLDELDRFGDPITAADLAAGAAGDDDGDLLALDRYAAMDSSGELSAEDEYEAALANEVDWELDDDGDPVIAEPDPDEGETPVEGALDDPSGTDVLDEDDGPDGADEGMAALESLFG